MTIRESTAVSEGLRREFTFRSTFSLAFAFISPIIGLYTIFALSLDAAGPAFWWGFFIVLGGQLLVALVLAELTSVWPLAGGLYKWTQKLAGRAQAPDRRGLPGRARRGAGGVLDPGGPRTGDGVGGQTVDRRGTGKAGEEDGC